MSDKKFDLEEIADESFKKVVGGLSTGVVDLISECTGLLRESSKFLSDKIMQRRVRNLVDIFVEFEKLAEEKQLRVDAATFFEQNGVKFLTKFIDEASLSSDDFKPLWAQLLTSTSQSSNVKSEVVATLGLLDANSAKQLHEIAEITSHARAKFVLKRRREEKDPGPMTKWSPYHFRLDDVIDEAVEQTEILENERSKDGKNIDKKAEIKSALQQKGIFVYVIKDSEITGDFVRLTDEEKALLTQLYTLSRYDLITYTNKTVRINGWYIFTILADLTEYGKTFLDAISDGGYEFFDTHNPRPPGPFAPTNLAETAQSE